MVYVSDGVTISFVKSTLDNFALYNKSIPESVCISWKISSSSLQAVRYSSGVNSFIILFFIEKHWNELVRFSRRTTGSLNRWAAKYATISETILETYQKAKNKDAGRYVALNLTNFQTIEFRLFRGTLRYETFMATLQLVDEICRTALRLYDRDMENLSWSEFVQNIDKEAKPELIAYLKSRRLYVNETTTETEEY